MRSIIHLCTALFAIVILVGCGGSPDPAAKQWIDQFRAADAAIKSVQVAGAVYVAERKTVADENSTVTSTFEYRASGDMEWYHSESIGGPEGYIVRTGDDAMATHYTAEGLLSAHNPDYEMRSVIREVSTGIPIPSRMPIILKSILTMAAQGDTIATDETREIEGVTCRMFEFTTDLPARVYHVYVDEAIGGTPRQIEEIDIETGNTLRVITFENFQEVSQGVHLPMRYRLRGHNSVDPKRWQENLIVIEKWIVNEDIPPESFIIPTN